MESKNTEQCLLDFFSNKKDLENEIVKRMNNLIKHDFEGGISLRDFIRKLDEEDKECINHEHSYIREKM